MTVQQNVFPPATGEHWIKVPAPIPASAKYFQVEIAKSNKKLGSRSPDD